MAKNSVADTAFPDPTPEIDFASPKSPAQIVTAIGRPGWIGPTGDAYSAEALRRMADNVTLFWDDESQTLWYRGPWPEEKR